jgi:DNA-directed RNA polymerase subunit RPC12/RpoP
MGAKCSQCGETRSEEDAQADPHPPCPHCGSSAIIFELAIAGEVNVTGALSWQLQPGDQSRGWKARWDQIQRELKEILAPHLEQLSAETIHAARHRLHSFYVQTYHLKDALIAEAPSTGVLPREVEDAVTNDPNLSLLADLANLDKHGNLKNPPRSGHVPQIGSVAGESSSTSDGWRLVLTIGHGAGTRDGLQVAQAATDSWSRALAGWGLI